MLGSVADPFDPAHHPIARFIPSLHYRLHVGACDLCSLVGARAASHVMLRRNLIPVKFPCAGSTHEHRLYDPLIFQWIRRQQLAL